MTRAEVRSAVIRALHRIAPEADLESLPGDADLRAEVDLDSMDLLNFFVLLHQELRVDIAESDYGRMATLDGCVTYLEEKLAVAAPAGQKTAG